MTELHHAPNSSESVLLLYHPSPLPHTSAPELPLYAWVAKASRPSSLAEKLIAEWHGYLFDLILRQLTSPSCTHSTGNGMEIGSCPTKLAERVISEVSDLEWLGMAVDVSSLPTLSHVPAQVDKFLVRIEASFWYVHWSSPRLFACWWSSRQLEGVSRHWSWGLLLSNPA